MWPSGYPHRPWPGKFAAHDQLVNDGGDVAVGLQNGILAKLPIGERFQRKLAYYFDRLFRAPRSRSFWSGRLILSLWHPAGLLAFHTSSASMFGDLVVVLPVL